ncbi:MAG: 16S rRNA (uracil(1498)-N(3))-methyltransferase [Planctomycetia bacterium]|nr:16S rRNA (uracil(1498)-N(3))-methyltransferase [Planctomycetia bacterium]
MSERFFTPDVLGPGEYELTGAEAHHLRAVRRFKRGDQVTLFTGDGNEYPAEILSASKKAVLLRVLEAVAVDRELPFPLVIGSAIPKGDRADFLIEKLTELGVTQFVPLITERSIVEPKPSVVAKYQRAVIEASKQCGRNRLMAIDQPRKWVDFLKRDDLPRTRLVLHTDPDLPAMSATGECVVGVGPEGGLSLEEISSALAAGWQLVSLGPRVLRVETAAIAAAAKLGERPA